MSGRKDAYWAYRLQVSLEKMLETCEDRTWVAAGTPAYRADRDSWEARKYLQTMVERVQQVARLPDFMVKAALWFGK
jgi:hypothetical protein